MAKVTKIYLDTEITSDPQTVLNGGFTMYRECNCCPATESWVYGPQDEMSVPRTLVPNMVNRTLYRHHLCPLCWSMLYPSEQRRIVMTQLYVDGKCATNSQFVKLSGESDENLMSLAKVAQLLIESTESNIEEVLEIETPNNVLTLPNFYGADIFQGKVIAEVLMAGQNDQARELWAEFMDSVVHAFRFERNTDAGGQMYFAARLIACSFFKIEREALAGRDISQELQLFEGSVDAAVKGWLDLKWDYDPRRIANALIDRGDVVSPEHAQRLWERMIDEGTADAYTSELPSPRTVVAAEIDILSASPDVQVSELYRMLEEFDDDTIN